MNVDSPKRDTWSFPDKKPVLGINCSRSSMAHTSSLVRGGQYFNRIMSLWRSLFVLRNCHAPERVHGTEGFQSCELLLVLNKEGPGKGKRVEGNVF